MVATKQKYPKYKITQWIDTSEEAMNKEQATIRYGVDIKPKPSAGVNGGWLHLARNNTPLIFDTAEEASAEIRKLETDAVPNVQIEGQPASGLSRSNVGLGSAKGEKWILFLR